MKRVYLITAFSFAALILMSLWHGLSDVHIAKKKPPTILRLGSEGSA